MSFSIETNELLKTRIGELPPELIACLTDDSLEGFLAILQEKHRLSDAQVNLISNEMVMVLMAFEPLSELSTNMVDSAVLSQEVSDEIATAFKAIFLDEISRTLLEEIEELQSTPEKTDGAAIFVEEQSQIPQTTQVVSSPKETNVSIKSPSEAEVKATSTLEQSSTPKPPLKTDAAVLEKLRTMAKDADRIHGYGTYRSKYPTPEEARANAAAPKNSQGAVAEPPKYTSEE